MFRNRYRRKSPRLPAADTNYVSSEQPVAAATAMQTMMTSTMQRVIQRNRNATTVYCRGREKSSFNRWQPRFCMDVDGRVLLWDTWLNRRRRTKNGVCVCDIYIYICCHCMMWYDRRLLAWCFWRWESRHALLDLPFDSVIAKKLVACGCSLVGALRKLLYRTRCRSRRTQFVVSCNMVSQRL